MCHNFELALQLLSIQSGYTVGKRHNAKSNLIGALSIYIQSEG